MDTTKSDRREGAGTAQVSELEYYEQVAKLGNRHVYTRTIEVRLLQDDEKVPEPYPGAPDTIFEIDLRCGRIMPYDSVMYIVDEKTPLAFPRCINVQNIGGCWRPAAEIMKLVADGHMARAFRARPRHQHPMERPYTDDEYPYLLLCFGKTKEQERLHQLKLQQIEKEEKLKRKIDELEDTKMRQAQVRKRRRVEPIDGNDRKDEFARASWLRTKLTEMTLSGDNDATLTALRALDPPRHANVLRKLESAIQDEEMQMTDVEHKEFEAKLDNQDTTGEAYRTVFCQWNAVDTTKAEAATRLSEWFAQNAFRPDYPNYSNNEVPTPQDCEMFLDMGFVKVRNHRILSSSSSFSRALCFQKVKFT